MRILVIGGMHGNEPLGPEVVKLFNENPVQDVDVIIANPYAHKLNSRFVSQDLNRSFPGNKDSSIYEDRRASELTSLAAKYDLVLDFHNTYCPDNDCCFMGDNARRALNDIAWVLGLNKMVIADYDCINKYADNCISVEISMDSPLNNAGIWYERITTLSRIKNLNSNHKIERFKFVYRMTLDDNKKLKLDTKNLEAFKPLPSKLSKAMNVQSPAYPIFINDKFTPYNYGGVLNKM